MGTPNVGSSNMTLREGWEMNKKENRNSRSIAKNRKRNMKTAFKKTKGGLIKKSKAAIKADKRARGKREDE
jgi:hypothetical protein